MGRPETERTRDAAEPLPAVLDTNVLIDEYAPVGVVAAISVISLTELHFGALVATDEDERARRTGRLATIEATFDPVEITPEVAREWGRLAAAVMLRGGQPRRRQLDLGIAATANVNRAALLTANVADFQIIDDLVDVRDIRDFVSEAPPAPPPDPRR